MKKKLEKYQLKDYFFLQDYIVVKEQADFDGFVAQIKNSEQLVRVKKIKFEEELLPRFEKLVELFNQGVVLADNIFLLEESSTFYFYVIEAYVDEQTYPFRTMRTFLYNNPTNPKILLDKIKLLLDCVHQTGEPYLTLTPQSIIIDQEQQLYLSPFSLPLDLPSDRYTSAYYSPDLILQISQSQPKSIKKKTLINSDIWAFGCILGEIYGYCTPLFYSPNNALQLQILEKENELQRIAQELELSQSLKNLFFNCLCKNYDNRKLSSEPPALLAKQKQAKQSTIQTGEGNCELSIHFLSVSGLQIQHQLRVNLYANQQYSLFVSKDTKQNQKNLYNIDRKIILKGVFQQFQQLLDQPLCLELIEKNSKCKITVNLSTLIIIMNGKRTWQKPLIGSYSSKSQGNFGGAKIKLSCQLKTPLDMVFEKKEQIMIPPTLCQIKKEEKNVNIKPNENEKENKNILSKINTNLTQITKIWRQKASYPQEQKIEKTQSDISAKVKKILLRK